MNHFDYFTDIEKHFIKRRGKHLMIGPLDWSLIESWQKREVPLRIVLSAIDEVFDSIEQRNDDASRVRSLKYCSETVETRFAAWKRAQAGKARKTSPDVSVKDLEEHIDALTLRISELSPSVPRVLRRAVTEAVETLMGGVETDFSSFTRKLDQADAEIDRSIVENRNELVTEKLRAAAEKMASEFGIDPNKGGGDFERIVCRAVRAEYGIPNLGFYKL